MATTFFLRDAASDLGGPGQKLLSTTRGAASTTAVTNTVLGPANIQITKTAGGQVLSWFTGPLATVTISSAFTANVRGLESTTFINAGCAMEVWRCDIFGNQISAIYNASVPNVITEWTTVDTAKNDSALTVTSTTLANGDRIEVVLRTTDAGGTMGTGTVTYSYDGPTSAAAGDTFVTFVETVTALALAAPPDLLMAPHR